MQSVSSLKHIAMIHTLKFGKFIHELLRIYQEKPDYPDYIDAAGWRWMGYDYADHMYGLRHMIDHSAAGLENQFLRQRF